MTKKDVKQIIESVIIDKVNPRFKILESDVSTLKSDVSTLKSDLIDFKDDIISSFQTATEVMKEEFFDQTKLWKEYIDGLNNVTNQQINDVKEKQNLHWNILVKHDTILEKR